MPGTLNKPKINLRKLVYVDMSACAFTISVLVYFQASKRLFILWVSSRLILIFDLNGQLFSRICFGMETATHKIDLFYRSGLHKPTYSSVTGDAHCLYTSLHILRIAC